MTDTETRNVSKSRLTKPLHKTFLLSSIHHNARKILLVVVGTMLILTLAYFFIFGNVILHQKNDHLRIALAMPAAILNTIAPLHDHSWLVKNKEACDMRKAMTSEGFAVIGGGGIGYLLEKNGEVYSGVGEHYTCLFSIFTFEVTDSEKWHSNNAFF